MKSPESKKSPDLYMIVAGDVGFSSALAEMLLARGDSVLIIAGNRSDLSSIPPSLARHAMVGEITDMRFLKEANGADAVIAAMEDDSANILAAQFAREVLGAKHVLARLNDFDRAGVYREFGIATFNPALICAEAVIRELSGTKKVENA